MEAGNDLCFFQSNFGPAIWVSIHIYNLTPLNPHGFSSIGFQNSGAWCLCWQGAAEASVKPGGIKWLRFFSRLLVTKGLSLEGLGKGRVADQFEICHVSCDCKKLNQDDLPYPTYLTYS